MLVNSSTGCGCAFYAKRRGCVATTATNRVETVVDILYQYMYQKCQIQICDLSLKDYGTLYL